MVYVLVFVGFVYFEVFDCFCEYDGWLVVGVYCLCIGCMYFFWIVVVVC